MLDFPDSPTDGEQTLQPNGVTYQWNASLTRWEVVSVNGGDYAQGVWTPTIEQGDGTGATSYSTQQGTWERIGRLVTFRGRVTVTDLGAITLDALIGGLPFPAAGAGIVGTISCGFGAGMASNGETLAGYILGGTSEVVLTKWSSSIGTTTFDLVTQFTDSGDIAFEGHYYIDEADKGVGNPAGLAAIREGVWTPIITNQTIDATPNGAVNEGSYSRIGKQVWVQGYCATTALNGAAGTMYMKGLPFLPAAGKNGGISMVYGQGLALTALANVTGLIQPSDQFILLGTWDEITGTGAMQSGEWGEAGNARFIGQYQTDDA